MERRWSGFKKILDACAFESEKRGETVVPRFESTRTDFFLILPNLNYGRKINGVESSSEPSSGEATTEATAEVITDVTTEVSMEVRRLVAAMERKE